MMYGPAAQEESFTSLTRTLCPTLMSDFQTGAEVQTCRGNGRGADWADDSVSMVPNDPVISPRQHNSRRHVRSSVSEPRHGTPSILSTTYNGPWFVGSLGSFC